MALFYVCALLMAPMLFMGMIGSARAEDVQEPIKDTSVTGPGKCIPYTIARCSRCAASPGGGLAYAFGQSNGNEDQQEIGS